MKIIDRGGGTAIVVIPGIQGRWESMKPGIDMLAQRCHVITFSLADEPTAGAAFDERRWLDSYVDQVREALDKAGIQRAAILGMSYGGLIAAAWSEYRRALACASRCRATKFASYEIEKNARLRRAFFASRHMTQKKPLVERLFLVHAT